MTVNKKSTQPNPLASPQRETAGANTFEKYEYQYHWALCRILHEHTNNTDYAVFVELHEDVVLSTSMDVSKATFEFNQIKSLSSKTPLKIKNIIQRKKVNRVLKNSILGKMLIGVKDKPFFNKLDNINLVVTCGFDIKLKTDRLKLQVISLNEIDSECVKEIQDAINIEIENFDLPSTLNFLTPELPDKCFQDVSIGTISRLINTRKSGAMHNPELIYQALIDELHRKGSIQHDYTQWENLIKSKGVTGETVESTILKFTENKDYEKKEAELFVIVSELGLKHNESTKVKKAFSKYHNNIHFNRALSHTQDESIFKNIVLKNYNVYEDMGLEIFINNSLDQLLKSNKISTNDPVELKAGVIYELINQNEEN